MVRDFTSIDDISEPTPLQADVEALEAWTGFRPRTSVVEGVARFAAWSRHDDGS
jgi:UDP-glucuronate 4-epimerase